MQFIFIHRLFNKKYTTKISNIIKYTATISNMTNSFFGPGRSKMGSDNNFIHCCGFFEVRSRLVENLGLLEKNISVVTVLCYL